MPRQFSASGVVRRCAGGCDGREDGAVEAMLQFQRVSDFLIAASYLSIPLELLYFASCAKLAPVKWLLLQLAAFAVLGGATHLLAIFTHHHPHSSGLLLASTATKLLAAVVSFATAVSLISFIPRLIRVKLREALLRTKARQLDRDLGLIRRRVEATSHVVRMLTHHIRSSPLDAHTILHTTMIHLADALALHSCAVWMPGEDDGGILELVHQLSPTEKGLVVQRSLVRIPADDPDVVHTRASEAAKMLRPGSELAAASSGGLQPPGSAASIRMPMLKVSNFDRGRAPEASSYAILVLVLGNRDGCRGWSSQDMEIVQVVADQVAVALSHAAVLEEWQAMRDKLAEQHRALLQAKQEATVATNAISSIRSDMCDSMRRPMHSIIGLLSMVRQLESMRPEQRLVADAIARTSTLTLALMNDANTETLTMNRVPFDLRAVIMEAMSIAGCLSGCQGGGFLYQSANSIPEWVVGDETRVFHLLLHMVGAVLSRRCNDARRLSFSVKSCNVREEDYVPTKPKPNLSASCSMCVKIQVGMERSPSCSRSPHGPASSQLSICSKIVQMMNGSMRWTSDGEGITLILQFQLKQSDVCLRKPLSIPQFNGLRILLADAYGMSRGVTKKLLEKLGCQVMSVSSGIHCLALLGSADSSFQLLLLDLGMDGFEVALRIRELRNRYWLLIVVALEVAIDDAIREMCRRSEIYGLIRKPITLTALGAQLCRVLQNN